MSTHREIKIKKFLDLHKPGTVCLASWMEENSISRDLQKRYRKSGWLQSFGIGAFKRPHDDVRWQGALYALQEQARMPIHAGASTALSLQGFAHYFRLEREKIFLFSPLRKTLPGWFRNHAWGLPIKAIKTSFLPPELSLTNHEEKTFSINISTPERAIMECLFLAPGHIDLVEVYHIMEGLANLRPQLVEQLLKECTSIKVKRLFLYMADKVRHQWLPFVDQNNLELGKGDRSIAPNGVYIAKFKIIVPKELAQL